MLSPPPPPPILLRHHSSAMASSFNLPNDDYSSDDISLILQQLLQHSPQPNSSLPPPASGLSLLNDSIPAAANPTSSSGDDSPTLGSSAQLKGADNDATDEYDGDTDEEAQRNKHVDAPLRNSSKRARAAEVHNMSEKRRRSRINEKMKALQNLIPNSNKSDKASMLDEAIEYLKRLQLQVQMLSMRNGLMLNPMCLPGFPGVLDPVQLSQMGLNFSQGDGSLGAAIAHALPSLPSHHCGPSTRPVLDTFPATVTAPPCSLQPSMGGQLISSFHLPSSSQSNICSREHIMVQHQLDSTVPMHTAVGNTSHIQLISSNLEGLNPGSLVYDDEV